MNQKKTLLYGSRATALTIVVVLVVLLINGLTSYLVKEFPQAKLDITPERRYSLSQETKEYLQNVSAPIKMIALGGQNYEEIMVEMQYVRDTVARMAKQNDQITYEEIELYKDEQSMQAFLDKYVANAQEEMSVFSVILENPADGSFRVATPTVIDNIFSMTVSYEDFESKVVNAIHKLLNGDEAETVTIPNKPEYKPELMLGVNPETNQADEELLLKQLGTFSIVFIVVLPLIAFVISIVVFVAKRKK